MSDNLKDTKFYLKDFENTYNSLLNMGQTVITIRADRCLETHDVVMLLNLLIKAANDTSRKEPTPERVLFNGPATVMFFDDGTKTVSKCNGDEFDPLFGIIACAVRKAGRNRVRVDSWEPFIQFLADNLGSAKECRFLAEVLNMTADAWELDWVDETMGEWASKKDEESFEESFGDPDPQPEPETLQEQVRQTIRDLIDRGEL